MATPEEEAYRLLQETQAPWQEDGFGLRGNLPSVQPQPVYIPRNPDRAIERPIYPDAPDIPDLPTPAPPTATPGPSTIYSFMMEDATDNEGAKVLIRDGEVSTNGGDGQLPDGMGNDDFILNINADGDDVWVEVTYDTSTLALTSLTIGTGTGTPDSSLGNAYVLIGYVTFGTLNPQTGFPTSTEPHNTQCGDINIDQIYGAFNGQPALFLLSQVDVPQPLM